MTGPITTQNITLKEAVPQVRTVGKSAGIVSVNCECDSVTISENNDVKEDESAFNKLKEGISDVANKITETAKQIILAPLGFGAVVLKTIGIFSPLMDFIEGDKKQTVKDLNKVLQGIQTKLNEDNAFSESLSADSKEAIKKLIGSVTELSGNKDFQSRDISELIAKWRENKDHKTLLEMAEHIRKGECTKFVDEELKKQFIEALESLGQALAELSGQPDSSAKREVYGELTKAADKVVDNVEIHNGKGGDANFTKEDKEKIAENFEGAARHVENVTNNPELASLIPHTYSRLFMWVESLYDFLQEWLETKEEEKEKEEKLCEERCEQKKKYYEMRHKEEVAKKKEMHFRALMHEMMQKIRYAKLNKFEREKVNGAYYYAKDISTSEAYKADYYESKKCEVVESMPPSYVCGNGFILDLDITC